MTEYLGLVKDAINNKKEVIANYHEEGHAETKNRVLEIHSYAFGLANRREYLYAYQTEGESRRGINNEFKRFFLDRFTQMQFTSNAFSRRENFDSKNPIPTIDVDRETLIIIE